MIMNINHNYNYNRHHTFGNTYEIVNCLFPITINYWPDFYLSFFYLSL